MLDAFILSIDPEKFRLTNSSWNSLMLNDPWSVGYVSSLIENQTWANKEEWERFYYSSGSIRRNMIERTNLSILDNFDLVRLNKAEIARLPYNVKNLNYNYGRTVEDLQKKATSLKLHTSSIVQLSDVEAFECVRFRTICETWNGIVLRENNTIKNLQVLFPNASFKKTEGNIDHQYAVDYEVFDGVKLICAIQIKPKSYLSNAFYIMKAKAANEEKYKAYTRLHNVPVVTIISNASGIIYNQDAVQRIKQLYGL